MVFSKQTVHVEESCQGTVCEKSLHCRG